MLTSTSSSTGGVSRATSNNGPGQHPSGSSPVQHAFPIITLTNRANTSGVRCFGCGETGHRQADCKNQGKKTLFVDPDDYEEEDVYMGEEPVFDGIDKGDG